MSFVNRLIAVIPSMGVPLQNDTLFLSQNNAVSGTAQATVSLTGLTPTISKGYVRVKLGSFTGTSPTLLNLIVVVTDGTNYVTVFFFAPVVAIAPGFSIVPAGTTIASANGHITSGAAVLTSASALFTPAMVGQPVSLSNAGTGGIVLFSSILSYQSPTQVTIANNAGATSTTATVKLTSTYGNGGSDTSLGGLDFLIPFECDLNVTEVDVLYTFGGTTPAAVMDIEVSGTT